VLQSAAQLKESEIEELKSDLSKLRQQLSDGERERERELPILQEKLKV